MPFREQKVLLMGRAGCGKTSMRSIVFANHLPRDTRRLEATVNIEYTNVRFLDNLVLRVWDCGGHDKMLDNYLSFQRDDMFKHVKVLIFVFDVESKEIQRDLAYFKGTVDAIQTHSPAASVFCLIHKIDLIPCLKRVEIQNRLEKEILVQAGSLSVKCFATTIWDESLYQSWSEIACTLIPYHSALLSTLQKVCETTDAHQCILFEKTTFLELCSTKGLTSEKWDHLQSEKMSTVLKHFKVSTSKSHVQFQTMEVSFQGISIHVAPMSPSLMCMFVFRVPICPALIHLHVETARRLFHKQGCL
ncbi:ras-related GTP-binding protein A [Chytriomyces sp. MP71]|nr:ras-related GTP-binding protein A [Chytriomyces sp. MP71]